MDFDIKKKFRPKPKNKVGLDIGSSAVKMIEIVSSEDAGKLISLGSKKASGAVRGPLIEAIRSLSEEIKISAKDVNISVSGPSVIVRFVSMPKMREEELKNAIKFEAEKYIPFSINDCIVDHQVLRRNDRENKLDILLVAVKKAHVLDRIAIAEECGFTVGVVDVDTFAMANSFFKNFPTIDPDKAIALLDIGASFTNVGIVRGGALWFARDVAIGADTLIQSAKSVANNLLDEMRLSFSYYENQSGKGVDEIYISGGGAIIADLEGMFQDAFESKPCIWDPLKFLDKAESRIEEATLDKMKSSFAVAAGLALR